MQLKEQVQRHEYLVDVFAVAEALLRRSPLVLEAREADLDALLVECDARLAGDDAADPGDAW